MKILDPNNNYLDFAIFRDSCLWYLLVNIINFFIHIHHFLIILLFLLLFNSTEKGLHVKDLRIFSNRKMENLIMVDNSSYVFGLNIDNGVPIIPFYDCKEDDELILLENYLMTLKNKDIK